MGLNTVTITGADDSTPISELLALADDFPFVEFGILIAKIGPGGWRMPSVEWIRHLVDRRDPERHRLSLHLCGRSMAHVLGGKGAQVLLEEIGPQLLAFQRAQLNFHGVLQSRDTWRRIADSFIVLQSMGWDPEVILQLDGLNNFLLTQFDQTSVRVSGLFDGSHGAGVCPKEWPPHILGRKTGWAGGLGADNLEVELPRIHQAWGREGMLPAYDYWVDMETKVIGDKGGIDVRLAREALAECVPFVDK